MFVVALLKGKTREEWGARITIVSRTGLHNASGIPFRLGGDILADSGTPGARSPQRRIIL